MKKYKFIVGLLLLSMLIHVFIGEHTILESIYGAMVQFLASLILACGYIYTYNKHSKISLLRVWNITYSILVGLAFIVSILRLSGVIFLVGD